jgi:hypothetical protein
MWLAVGKYRSRYVLYFVSSFDTVLLLGVGGDMILTGGGGMVEFLARREAAGGGPGEGCRSSEEDEEFVRFSLRGGGRTEEPTDDASEIVEAFVELRPRLAELSIGESDR